MRKKWRLLYSFSYLPQNGFLLWPHAPPRPKSSCRATSLRTENPQASRVVAWCLRGIHPAVALDSPPSQPDLTSQSRVSESHGLKSSPAAKEAGGVNQVYQRRRQGQQMQRRGLSYIDLWPKPVSQQQAKMENPAAAIAVAGGGAQYWATRMAVSSMMMAMRKIG